MDLNQVLIEAAKDENMLVLKTKLRQGIDPSSPLIDKLQDLIDQI